MRVRAVVSCLLAFVVVVAVKLPHVAGEAAKGVGVGDLSGEWTYDAGLSDDARAKMREARERRGRPDGEATGFDTEGARASDQTTTSRSDGEGADRAETMRAILQPSEGLTITQSDQEIVIDETYGRSRRLRPNGRRYKADNGTAEVKAEWKDGRLMVETTRAGGGRIVETWERSATGTRLTVTYRIKGERGPSLVLRRIYQRAPAPVSSKTH